MADCLCFLSTRIYNFKLCFKYKEKESEILRVLILQEDMLIVCNNQRIKLLPVVGSGNCNLRSILVETIRV